MWKQLFEQSRAHSRAVSISAFFLWAIFMVFTSPAMGTFWATPVLAVAHLISAGGIYFGFVKDASGKRTALGVILSIVTMLYNLSFDTLYLFV